MDPKIEAILDKEFGDASDFDALKAYVKVVGVVIFSSEKFQKFVARNATRITEYMISKEENVPRGT